CQKCRSPLGGSGVSDISDNGEEARVSKQGQGDNTRRKEDGFGAIFHTSLDISKGARRYPYWHIDLNAGSGFNEKAQCPGSPVVFMQEAARAARWVRAYFTDLNAEAAQALRQRLAGMPLSAGGEALVFCEDNSAFLERVADMI